MPASPPSHHVPAYDDSVPALGDILPAFGEIIILKEKVAALETWRASTETDLKAIHDVISQVKLLMSLSIGGGGLSVLTLIISLILLVTGKQ